MRRLALLPALMVAAFALAACSSSGSSPAASAPAPAGSAASSGGGGAGGGACAKGDAGATAAVSVEIKDFKFGTDPVEAKVGDAIGWTNGDSAPHTATLDDGSCDTGNINQGATGVLVFNAAGTYTYHCTIHTNMKGTINVS